MGCNAGGVASIGRLAAARALGDELLAVTPDDPTGLFLKGAGLLLDTRYSEARRVMQEATSRSPDAQFLEGLGRVSETFSGLRRNASAPVAILVTMINNADRWKLTGGK